MKTNIFLNDSFIKYSLKSPSLHTKTKINILWYLNLIYSMLLLRIKGTRKTIIQSKGARQAQPEAKPAPDHQ